MSIRRNVVVAGAAVFLFLVVAGAVYLEILLTARATDRVWAVTTPVSAGDELNALNLKQVRFPQTGDNWDYYQGNLLAGGRRAAHDMRAGTIVFRNDVLDQDMALVTLSLKTPPPLSHGSRIDVYAQVGGQTIMVGRGLIVQSVSGANCSVWVPASDEPAWVTVAASNLALFAARSSGVGVPQATRGQGVSEAVATLSGGSLTGPPAVVPSPRPSASPSPR